jgi:MFS family permease
MHHGAGFSFISRNRRSFLLLLSMCFVYLFSFFQRMAIPGTIFDLLQADFALSASGVSFLGAIYLYVYGAMQIPTGILVDRFGGVRMLAVGGFLLVVGSFLFPIVRGLPLLYATRALIGIGSSLIYVSILKEISDLFEPRHFAIIVGLALFIGYSGGLIGTLPFERAADAWGWRPTLIGIAVASAVFYAFFAVLSARTRPGAARQSTEANAARPGAAPSSLAPLAAVLGNRSGYPIMMGYPIQFAIYFVVQGPIGKKMLQDTMGVSSVLAAGVTFAMMAVSIVCASTSGFVSRLFGDRRRPIIIAAGIFSCVSIIGALSGLLLSAPPLALAASFILLAFSTVGGTINTAVFKELNVRRNAGTAVGVLNACTYLLIAFLSNGAGWVLDAFQAGARRVGATIIYPRQAYVALFLILLSLGAVALISSLRVRETRGGHAGGYPRRSLRPPPRSR